MVVAVLVVGYVLFGRAPTTPQGEVATGTNERLSEATEPQPDEYVPPQSVETVSSIGQTPVVRLTYPNGDIYVGSVRDDKPQGFGTLQYADPPGAVYAGDFLDGVPHGKGIKKTPSRNWIYEGDFVKGRRHGQGVIRWADGAKYEGEWRTGKRHGQGAEYAPSGAKLYEGQWEDDQQNGAGTLYREAGTVLYTGSWRDGEIDGQGAEQFLSGESWSGKFVAGQGVGMGEWLLPSGHKELGLYHPDGYASRPDPFATVDAQADVVPQHELVKTGVYRAQRKTPVRASPSDTARIVAELRQGQRVQVVDGSDTYFEVRSKKKRPPGFVKRDDLTFIK